MRIDGYAIVLAGLAAIAWGGEAKSELLKDLEQQVMAPCCYGSPVGDHDSEAARHVRVQLAGMVAEGKTRGEILDKFVELYGERILASPRASGFNLMAYVVPPAILLLGGLFLIVVLKRLMPVAVPLPQPTPERPPSGTFVGGRSGQPGVHPAGSRDEEVARRIEREMKELGI